MPTDARNEKSVRQIGVREDETDQRFCEYRPRWNRCARRSHRCTAKWHDFFGRSGCHGSRTTATRPSTRHSGECWWVFVWIDFCFLHWVLPHTHAYRVVLVPHLGSATRNTRVNMAIVSAQNVINGIEGKPMIYAVY